MALIDVIIIILNSVYFCNDVLLFILYDLSHILVWIFFYFYYCKVHVIDIIGS